MIGRRLALWTAVAAGCLPAQVGSITWAAPTRPQGEHTGSGPAKLDEVRIYLILKDGARIVGELAAYDAKGITVRNRLGKLESAAWEQLKPMGCYFLQKRLTDPTSSEVNFRLGYYCYNNGLRKDAQAHFTQARELAPAYAEKIKQIYLGRFNGTVDLAVALNDPKELAEVERLAQEGHHGSEPQRLKPPKKVVKFHSFSPAFQAKALEQIRTFGEKVNEKLGARLRTVETEHYVIFTNWPSREDRALGMMFETIYDRLCRQFDIPTSQNIFLGKLPVFCWTRRKDYVRFAKEIDHYPVRSTTVAYVIGNIYGYQHMNIFRYPNRLWLEKIVTHESVHTFVNRYRSNIPLVAWLNEGLAEVMAGTLVPRSRTIERSRTSARHQVRRSVGVESLLRSGYKSPTSKQYALACTLVDYLIRKDPAKFLSMIDSIKSGARTEAALKDAYGVDYDGFATVWREWVARNYPKL